MAKTIKITFYSPKELWAMFWQKFFWPRKKSALIGWIMPNVLLKATSQTFS